MDSDVGDMSLTAVLTSVSHVVRKVSVPKFLQCFRDGLVWVLTGTARRRLLIDACVDIALTEITWSG